MKNREILDDELLKKKDIIKSEIIQWWEKKRLLYNLLLFGVEILVMFSYWKETIDYGIGNAILTTLINNFIANIFYTAGWILEVFEIHYLKVKTPVTVRKTLFTLGALFTLVVAFCWYVIVFGNNGMLW